MADGTVILIVDDNLDAREMYCDYLRFEGFECIESASGEDAIAQARRRQPSLVIMDAMMPGMDGWQAVERLKADPLTRSIPVVMLTAHAFQEHRNKSLAAGADGFLPKPILPDQLAREIRRILSKAPPVKSGPKK